MPQYDYECKSCGHTLHDIQQSVKDAPLKKCSECKKSKLERVIHPPTVFVKDIKTIGQLADKNASLNKNLLQEQSHKKSESQPKEEVPWYKKGQTASSKELAKMTKEQKKKYIMEGKK
jgi:putative FmdB family regulatory protein